MLTGKKALITGASRGIGKAVALLFAQNGADIVICSRKREREVEQELQSYGVKARSLCCDVKIYDQVKQCVEETLDFFDGKLDVLANIAGISPKLSGGNKIPFWEMDCENWNLTMATNLDSMFYFSREVVPEMMKNQYGRIINMSSIAGLTNSEHGPASAAYVTSKSAVIGLTKAMAYDLAPYNITVNAVAPGRIDTDMSRSNNSYYNDLHRQLIPMHRFGTPGEVAEVFLFYASEKSSYITGNVTNITGGWFI